jgi:predicted Zn-dependent peptidase
MKLRFILAAVLAVAVAAPVYAAPAPVARGRTPGGAVVLAQVDRIAPRVAISLVLRAGAADETVATAGWRRLLMDAMLLGTRDPGSEGEVFLAGTELRERVEALGGRLSAQVGDDAIEMSITGPSTRAVALLDLLMAVATQPRLSDADVDRARRSLLRRLSDEDGAAEGSSGALSGLGGDFAASARALRRLEERLYRDATGAPVAYGLSPSGTLQSLSNLDAPRLRELLRGYFAPSRRVLSFVGDLNLPVLTARASQLETRGAWGVAPESRPAFAPISATSPPLDVMEDVAKNKDPIGITRGEGPAASVFLSYPVDTNALSPREVAAMQVLASALGQSTRGRLSRRLLDVRRTYGERGLPPGGAGSTSARSLRA